MWHPNSNCFINLYNIGGRVTKENRTKIMIAGKTQKFWSAMAVFDGVHGIR